MEAKSRRKLDEGTEDRISALPDDVVLLVLSLLPTVDAVRTSVPSKRWRHLWTLVSAVDISDLRDTGRFTRLGTKGTGRKKMLKFVDKCLKCPYAGTTLSKFKFEMKFEGDTSRVHKWLQFPGLRNLKELDIRIWHPVSYVLPHRLLDMRGLTVLKLWGRLELQVHPSPVSLPALKSLHLSVRIDDHALNYLLSACPSLNQLFLNTCRGLLDPQVTSSSLKLMEFRSERWDRSLRSLRIEAANLQSFVYAGGPGSVDLVRCLAIRNLTLSGASMPDSRLNDLVSKSPFLEILILDNCFDVGLQRVKISNRNLKHFVFASGLRSESLEATIDAPSMVSFRYTGVSIIKISVDAPNLADVYISICNYLRNNNETEWYVRLIKFLSEFNGCNSVCLLCCSKKALIIPDEVRKIHHPPLLDLKHMIVKAIGGEFYMRDKFRKALLWIAPSLESLVIQRLPSQHRPRRG